MERDRVLAPHAGLEPLAHRRQVRVEGDRAEHVVDMEEPPGDVLLDRRLLAGPKGLAAQDLEEVAVDVDEGVCAEEQAPQAARVGPQRRIHDLPPLARLEQRVGRGEQVGLLVAELVDERLLLEHHVVGVGQAQGPAHVAVGRRDAPVVLRVVERHDEAQEIRHLGRQRGIHLLKPGHRPA